MSVELISVLIAVLAIGAALAGLILTSNRGLRQDMREDMGQLRQGINELRGEIGELRERKQTGQGQLKDGSGRHLRSQLPSREPLS